MRRRSSGEREAREYVKIRGGEIYTSHALHGLENRTQLASQLDSIRDRIAAAGSPPAYLTLDIDCLDPAFAPGTGTPEPAGMTTSKVATFLEELSDLPFVGMDCVEMAPLMITRNSRVTPRPFLFGHICVGRLRRQKLEVDTTRADLSFPRRRAPSVVMRKTLDSRLRRNDGVV